MFEGLRKPIDLVLMVRTLLSSGCPVQASVQACHLDERPVADGRDRAGQHGHPVHEAIVEQETLDLGHGQADEIRVKGRTIMAWMGLAMIVSTRRWLAGTVSLSRDKRLADAVFQQVRRCGQRVCPLLVLTDGWAAYPGRMCRAFREKINATPGLGRACVQIWPDLHSATVITRTEKKRVGEITRTMAHGLVQRAHSLLARFRGEDVLTPAFLERLNGTFRERVACLTRNSRQAASRVQALRTGMDLRGCTSKFCFVHHELSTEKHGGNPCSPAMASGLPDHVWSFGELLWDNVAPAPWVEPKRRGPRPTRAAQPSGSTRPPCGSSRVRPLLRLRKGVFCSTTGSGGSTGNCVSDYQPFFCSSFSRTSADHRSWALVS
jgi:hypothetical protein